MLYYSTNVIAIIDNNSSSSSSNGSIRLPRVGPARHRAGLRARDGLGELRPGAALLRGPAQGAEPTHWYPFLFQVMSGSRQSYACILIRSIQLCARIIGSG